MFSWWRMCLWGGGVTVGLVLSLLEMFLVLLENAFWS